MSVHMWWDTLSRHIIIHGTLVKVAELGKYCRLLNFLSIALNEFIHEKVFSIEFKSAQNILHFWLHKLEKIRHLTHIFIYINVIGAVLEFKPIMLHSSIQKLAPFFCV